MRTLALLAALAGFVAPAAADDKDVKLKVGDKAPPVKAAKWLQGAEVKEFAAGKVYVVEFWSTWCGPCIVMMPHMGELHARYKDKGVTLVAFTTKDKNGNSLEKVQALVERRGPKLGYTFAYADDDETNDAWMKAAGRSGIPCCFVVDKAGKIAYIGHPMYLDVVLPKVVAGKWTEEDADAVKKVQEDVAVVFAAFRDPDAEAGLKELAAFQKAHPELAGIPYFHHSRITALLKLKRVDEAKKIAEELIAKGTKNDDHTLLTMVSGVLVSPAANGDKHLLALALTAAEAALKAAGDKDIFALLTLAEAHFANGDRAKAKEFGAKAVAAAEAESLGLKKFVADEVKKFDDKPKDK
jgi:thiol-disulfide isomerase/thioredoxin